MNTVVPKSEHEKAKQTVFLTGGLHWDEIRFFLAVADAGSFRGAAIVLSSSVNVVRKRIDDLEYELGCVLFTRSNSGVELTMDGRSVYSVAVEIREKVYTLDLLAASKSASTSGVVRLAVTEGLGTFWLMPKLSDFTNANPKLRLDLRCEMKVPDLSRLECDLAIQLEKPRDPKLIVRKIATLHILLYASRDYVARHGEIKLERDIENHTMVHLVADQIPSHMLQELFQSDPSFKFVRMIANTSSSQAMAILEGVGIGFLPSYASALYKNLVPIADAKYFHLERPVWLAFHPDAIRQKRVRSVADWIIDAFNSKKNPWFKDEFVEPDEFAGCFNKIDIYQRS